MPNLIKLWREVGKRFADLARFAGLFLVLSYRSIAAVHMGGACRFEPSCSCYAQEALNRLPFLTAVKLIIIRVLKCRPGGSFGLDPVPCIGPQEKRKNIEEDKHE